MGKGKPIIIVAFVIIALLVIGAFGLARMVPRMETRITGYSGMVSTIDDIEHSYDTAASTVTIAGTTADLELTGIADAATPTGLRMELGQPQYFSSRDDWSDSISVVDEAALTNTTKTWDAQIVTCRMGVSVRTDGTGLATVTDVTFWIEVQENSYSIFQDADESEAFIIEIRTYAEAYESDSSLVDVKPMSQGYRFPYEVVESDNTPAWITDSGYSGEISMHKVVQFPLTVVEMTPSSFLLNLRNEVKAEWYIEIDVLLFGYWEVMSPYTGFSGGGDDEVPLLDQLLAFLLQTAWILGGFIIMVVVVYLAPGRYKAFGPVVFVVFLLIGLGFFDSILGASGG